MPPVGEFQPNRPIQESFHDPQPGVLILIANEHSERRLPTVVDSIMEVYRNQFGVELSILTATLNSVEPLAHSLENLDIPISVVTLDLEAFEIPMVKEMTAQKSSGKFTAINTDTDRAPDENYQKNVRYNESFYLPQLNGHGRGDNAKERFLQRIHTHLSPKRITE